MFKHLLVGNYVDPKYLHVVTTTGYSYWCDHHASERNALEVKFKLAEQHGSSCVYLMFNKRQLAPLYMNEWLEERGIMWRVAKVRKFKYQAKMVCSDEPSDPKIELCNCIVVEFKPLGLEDLMPPRPIQLSASFDRRDHQHHIQGQWEIEEFYEK